VTNLKELNEQQRSGYGCLVILGLSVISWICLISFYLWITHGNQTQDTDEEPTANGG
jgi:hypothetical protein